VRQQGLTEHDTDNALEPSLSSAMKVL
jgi:hypothetical protein